MENLHIDGPREKVGNSGHYVVSSRPLLPRASWYAHHMTLIMGPRTRLPVSTTPSPPRHKQAQCRRLTCYYLSSSGYQGRSTSSLWTLLLNALIYDYFQFASWCLIFIHFSLSWPNNSILLVFFLYNCFVWCRGKVWRCDGMTARRHVFISLACDYILPPAFDYY